MEGGNEPSMKDDETHRCTHHYITMRIKIGMEIYHEKHSGGLRVALGGRQPPKETLFAFH